MKLGDINLRKIGILGGTFDPIHLGHTELAQKAQEHLELETVLFVPGGILPHKSSETIENKQHRLNMVKLAVSGFDKFQVSDYEVLKNSVCYTVDTLAHFQTVYKDSVLYFISGSDILFDLPDWKDTGKILKQCELVVFTRSNEYERILKQAEKIRAEFDASIHLYIENILNVSSTQIREALKTNKSCDEFLDDHVMQYINENGLYST